MSTRLRLIALNILLLSALLPEARAQWQTQVIDLKSGWNAVFLHVDAAHTNLNGLVGGDANNPIQEIWRWNPPSVAQFTSSPAEPTATLEWSSWSRTNASSGLQRLIGNAAYLVRVATNGGGAPVGANTYAWKVKGRPVAPLHDWTISGLNLIGFSTVTNNPPNFKAFLAQATEFKSATPEIYHYPGGELSTNNPVLIASPFLQQLIPVKRGQAFWMRSGTVFNRYFGPFEVVQSGSGGVDFGENSSSATFRLRNLTTSNLVVTLRLAASETPPVGQVTIAGLPPLLLRGAINLTNLTYSYTNLSVNSPHTWTLAARDLPGSEVEVVLGLNRTAITASPGALLAGILSFTDSLGFTLVQVPVSATAVSRAGLWVGNADVTQVSQYLKSYARDGSNKIIITTNGNYVVTNLDTSLATVPRTYPLRLIVHNPTNGSAVLLQRVYYGFDATTNVVVASGQSVLHPGYLSAARRISATHLPWTTTNTLWSLSGNLGLQTNLATTVTLSHDDQAANPFLHTYHPDHDNLDATFKQALPQGSESYTVVRAITLNVRPPSADFSSLVTGSQTLTGDYLETITLQGLNPSSRQYRVSGVFTLNRISQVPTLTLAP